MAKRTIETILAEVRRVKANLGCTTSTAMLAVLDDAEWDDLVVLVERLQAFWKLHADPPVPMKTRHTQD